MSDTAFIILAVVILILGVLVVPQLLVKRAAHSVIRIFREHNAVEISHAETIDNLGLKSLNMIEKLWKPRDYKPRALQLLLSADIIQVTEDGKLYLSEENLALTKWQKR